MNMNRQSLRVKVAFVISLIGAVHAQPAIPVLRTFEVASIKPNHSGPPTNPRATIEYFPGGRFSAIDVTLVDIIVAAYGTRRAQLRGGPDWIDSERFDVVAKTASAEGDVDGSQWRQRVRSLLEDRFNLKLHVENKELPAYALIPGKNLPKIVASKDDQPTTVLRGDGGRMTFQHVRMAGLVNTLANVLHEQVIDGTNIEGFYNFAVDPQREATPGGGGAESFPDLFLRAVEQQLGFKLEKRRTPIEVTVIDHAERPSAN
jgi:uncharacterized protein (TIGR03435 family)